MAAKVTCFFSDSFVLPFTGELLTSLPYYRESSALDTYCIYCIYCIHPFSHKCDIGHYIYKLHYILNI